MFIIANFEQWFTYWVIFSLTQQTFAVMFCAIWCHLCKLENMKNTYRGVLLLVMLQAFSLELY